MRPGGARMDGGRRSDKRRTAAGGGGQRTADGGQRTADSGRQTADGGQRTADGGRWTADSGRLTADGERQTSDGGQRTAGGGRRTVSSGQRTASPVARIPWRRGVRTVCLRGWRPKGKPFDSFESLPWVPKCWPGSFAPDDLRGLGAPWLFVSKAGHTRLGPEEWPLTGLGQFVVLTGGGLHHVRVASRQHYEPHWRLLGGQLSCCA